jgi:predicted anti-sigma-YlaC factor YlaD
MTVSMTMDHQAARELFTEFQEGDLVTEKQIEVQEHLESCAECRAEFEAFQLTVRSLSRLQRLKTPPEFVGKVQQRIHRRSRGRFFGHERLLLRIPFEWISFVIIILLLAMYLMMLQTQVKELKPGGKTPSRMQKALPPRR